MARAILVLQRSVAPARDNCHCERPSHLLKPHYIIFGDHDVIRVRLHARSGAATVDADWTGDAHWTTVGNATANAGDAEWTTANAGDAEWTTANASDAEWTTANAGDAEWTTAGNATAANGHHARATIQ